MKPVWKLSTDTSYLPALLLVLVSSVVCSSMVIYIGSKNHNVIKIKGRNGLNCCGSNHCCQLLLGFEPSPLRWRTCWSYSHAVSVLFSIFSLLLSLAMLDVFALRIVRLMHSVHQLQWTGLLFLVENKNASVSFPSTFVTFCSWQPTAFHY